MEPNHPWFFPLMSQNEGDYSLFSFFTSNSILPLDQLGSSSIAEDSEKIHPPEYTGILLEQTSELSCECIQQQQSPTSIYGAENKGYPHLETKKEDHFQNIHKSSRSDSLSIKSKKINREEFWDPEKIQNLLAWASQCRRDWKKVAKRFDHYQITPDFVRSKYRELTENAFPSRVTFKLEEDVRLAKCFKLYGTDWERISEFFPKRTALMLKNRYYYHIRKKNLLNKLLEMGEGFDNNLML